MENEKHPGIRFGNFRRLLTPPFSPEDEYQTFTSRVLHYTLLLLLFIGAIFPLFASSAAQVTFLPIMLFIVLSCFLLLHVNRFRLAGMIFLVGTWLVITVAAFSQNGLRNAGISGYTVVIIYSAILFTERAVILATSLSIASSALLMLGETLGYLPLRTTPLYLADRFFQQVALFAAAGVLLASAARVIRTSFTRSQSHKTLLLQHNRELRIQIAEREKVEAALRESEERFRLISSVTSDYTFASRFNERGEIIHTMLTGAFETISGYTPEEFVALGGWRATLHPDDLARDDRDLALLRQNQRVESELRIIKKSGEVRWVHVDAHPFWDEGQNRLIGIYGGVRDITDHKVAEDAILNLNVELEHKATQLAALNEIARDISALTDLNSTLRRVLEKLQAALPLDVFYVALYNPETQAITFPILYDNGQFWDQPPDTLSRSEWVAQVLQSGQPLLINRVPKQMDDEKNKRWQLGDVSRQSASILMSPLPMGDKNIGVISVQSYTPDSYERRHIDLLMGAGYQIAIAVENARLYDSLRNELAERRQAEAALRESEGRYRLVSEMISDYAYAYDIHPDGSFTPAWITEDSFQRMTEYRWSEIGETFKLYHPDDEKLARQHVEQTLRGEAASGEYRIYNRSGQLRWIQIRRRVEWDEQHRRPIRFYGVAQDITERKLAERALAESEERFRTFIQQASEGLVLADEQGLIIEWNQALTDLTGLARKAVIGQRVWDTQLRLAPLEQRSPALSEKIKTTVRGILQAGESEPTNRPTEAQIYHPERGLRYVQQSAFLVQSEHGWRIGAVIQDITERKQAEESLRRSEALLRALLDATTDVAFLMALDGTFLTLNRTMADSFGMTVEELTGQNGFERMSPQLREARRRQFEAVARTRQPQRWQDDTPSGWWDNSVYPVLSSSGAVEAFAVYSRNITQEKRLAAELQRYTAQLEEMVEERTTQLRRAKEQIEIILNNTRDAVALAHPNGDIRTTNPAFAALFGDRVSHSIERILWAIDSDEHIVLVGSALIQAIWSQEQQRVEAQIMSADGSGKDVDLTFIPVRLADEAEQNGILISAHDITHLKEIERFKARFVADAVHDLATPIAGLSTRLYLLKRSPEKLDEHVHALENQVEHLRNLLTDLRTLSQLDRKQLTLSPESCDLNQMALRIFDTYEPVAINKNQSLKLEAEPSLPEIQLDKRQIERVLVNLVSNAINYTPEGKTILVRTAVEEDTVLFSVEDEGIGISAEELPHIFERFYRTDKARQTQSSGTGLGLAIVKEIVDLHGGVVIVTSEPGRGSTFTICLPIRRSALAGG